MVQAGDIGAARVVRVFGLDGVVFPMAHGADGVVAGEAGRRFAAAGAWERSVGFFGVACGRHGGI